MKTIFRKKRILTAVLCSALVLTLAGQSTAAPFFKAYAQSVPLDSPEQEIDENEYVGNELLKDQCGEVVIYRWERMTESNYPKEVGVWHPMLLFAGMNNDYVFNPKGTEEYFLGKEHIDVEGAHRLGVEYYDENGDLKKVVSPHILGVDHSATAHTVAHYTANDPQLQPDKNIFYTSGNKDCMYMAYGGQDSHVNIHAFNMRISDGNQKMSDYYLQFPEGTAQTYKSKIDETGALIAPAIPGGAATVSVKLPAWTLKLSKGKKSGNQVDAEVFRSTGDRYFIYNENAGKDDNQLFLVNPKEKLDSPYNSYGHPWVLAADSDHADDHFRKWSVFLGEGMRFSAIKGSTTIRSGQILSITPDDYVDTSGMEQSQNGVMLQNGQTLTIEKGGVLSISGDFINNGTIINNGGTIIVKSGGTIYPFLQGVEPNKNGCGTIKCVSGDIIIQEGGAVYAGLNDEYGVVAPFYLDGNSTLINQGLLVYGNVRLGKGSRIECYDGAVTYGSYLGGDAANRVTVLPDATGVTVNGEIVCYTTGEAAQFPLMPYITYLNSSYSDYNALKAAGSSAYLEKLREEPDKYKIEENVPVYIKTGSAAEGYTKTPYLFAEYWAEFSLTDNGRYVFDTVDADGAIHLYVKNEGLSFKDILSRSNRAFLTGKLNDVRGLSAQEGAKGMYLANGVSKDDVTLALAPDTPIFDNNMNSTIELKTLGLFG